MISDPKAVRHVYVNSYSFTRQEYSRILFKMFLGPGLPTVDFDDHKRQRRVMQPAFGAPHLRDQFPIFIRHTRKVCPNNCDALY